MSAGPETPRVLVVGVGNRDRGDDGIGPAVVEALSLRTNDAETLVVEGDLSTLPLVWRPDDDVVIVDAISAPVESVGEMQLVDPHSLEATTVLSTHGIGVSEALRLAHSLGRSPTRVRVIGISGYQFGLGAMSPELRNRIDDCASRLLTTLGLSELRVAPRLASPDR